MNMVPVFIFAPYPQRARPPPPMFALTCFSHTPPLARRLRLQRHSAHRNRPLSPPPSCFSFFCLIGCPLSSWNAARQPHSRCSHCRLNPAHIPRPPFATPPVHQSLSIYASVVSHFPARLVGRHSRAGSECVARGNRNSPWDAARS